MNEYSTPYIVLVLGGMTRSKISVSSCGAEVHALPPCSSGCVVKACGVVSILQVRLRCQKGIPPALRGRAWLYLSGGKVKREQNQGKFQVSQLLALLLLLSPLFYQRIH